MKRALLLISITFLFSLSFIAQEKSAEEFQKELNTQYANPEKSPLDKKDLKKFKELPFYEINKKYIVTAQLKRTEKAKPFKMKTTTARLPEYVVYAVATFEIDGVEYSLNIYKSYGKVKPEYKNHLFLPFTDATNGDGSYGGGRFIDLIIPEGDEIVIDFNQAYNPYCAYSMRYSCPVPPKENDLNLRVEAGVKYDGH